MEPHMEKLPTNDVWMDADASSVSMGEKRKHTDEGEENGLQDLAEYCRQAVVPRTDIQRQDGDEQVQFYPLPPELNQAVLASLGVGGSKQAEHPNGVAIPGRTNQGYDASSSQFNSGLFQPEAPGAQGLPMQGSHLNGANAAGESMEEEVHTPGQASTSHGPHCKSIPQLSVRHYGGTASQLWALCPDCGAFSKVHEDKPVVLCYSP